MSTRKPSDSFGTIAWEVTEEPDSMMIYRGNRDLGRSDIQVFPLPEKIHRGPRPKPWTPAAAVYTFFSGFQKQIHLEGGFFFGLDSRPADQRTGLVGFGMRAGRATAHTFSWEWFNLDGEGRAKKLQEGGNLRIRLGRGVRGWEVAYTEFLSDISFRIFPSEGRGCLAGLVLPSPGPLWRIRIHKGSHVTWPLVGAGADAAPPN
jgi:hypothetical protein